jgi:hypothetical protein
MHADRIGLSKRKVFMSTLFYKDYAITPGAVLDESTGKYAPTVHFAWREASGKRDSRCFTLADRCSTLNDANDKALEIAKAWADRWLTPCEPAANWTTALKAINGRLGKQE